MVQLPAQDYVCGRLEAKHQPFGKWLMLCFQRSGWSRAMGLHGAHHALLAPPPHMVAQGWRRDALCQCHAAARGAGGGPHQPCTLAEERGSPSNKHGTTKTSDVQEVRTQTIAPTPRTKNQDPSAKAHGSKVQGGGRAQGSKGGGTGVWSACYFCRGCSSILAQLPGREDSA